MSDPTVIVCDIDGVVCDLTGRLLMAFNERWPGTPLERPAAWRTDDAYPHLSRAQSAWWEEAYANPYYYATALPVPYARESLFGARLFGLPVLYRSSRPRHLHATTRTWLEEWGFLAPAASLAAFACGPDAKADAALLDADRIVYVDDDAATLEFLHDINGCFARDYRYWLIDQPYNREWETPGVERLASVRDLPLLLGELWADDQPARVALPPAYASRE